MVDPPERRSRTHGPRHGGELSSQAIEARHRSMTGPLVEVDGVSKRYRRGAEEVHALREVAVVPQALGLVEELSMREDVELPARLAFADRILALDDGRLSEVAA